MCEVPGVSKEIKDDETLTVTFIDSIGGEPDTIGLSGKTLRKMAERIPPDEPCNHDWLFVKEIQRIIPEKEVEKEEYLKRHEEARARDREFEEKTGVMVTPFICDLRDFCEQGSLYRCSRCDETKEVY